MMLSLTTGPATSAFKPAPTISPIPARASGASWPKRETRARPVQLVPPARLAPPEPPEPRVLKGQREQQDQREQPEPRVLKGRRESAAQPTPIHRTEALNTRFKN